MTVEELREDMHEHRGEESEELAFVEYSSRLNWRSVPDDAPLEEQERIINELIARKIG